MCVRIARPGPTLGQPRQLALFAGIVRQPKLQVFEHGSRRQVQPLCKVAGEVRRDFGVGVEFRSLPGFLVVLVLASIGLAAALTLVAALLAQARTHAALASALAFPLVVPVLMAAIVGTRRAFTEPGALPPECRVLAAYAGVVVGIGILLAEHVLDD